MPDPSLAATGSDDKREYAVGKGTSHGKSLPRVLSMLAGLQGHFVVQYRAGWRVGQSEERLLEQNLLQGIRGKIRREVMRSMRRREPPQV